MAADTRRRLSLSGLKVGFLAERRWLRKRGALGRAGPWEKEKGEEDEKREERES